MLTDCVAARPRTQTLPANTDAPPPARPSRVADAVGEHQTLQARADAGASLTPVEQGTLARLMGTASFVGRIPYDPPTPPPPPLEHLTPDQVRAESRHILSVGDKSWQTDDYDARLKAYAQEMGKLDPASRKALTEQILKDDPGARNSWLQGDRLINLRNDGKISYADTTAVIDGYIDAYRAGNAGSVYDAIDFLSGGVSLTSMGMTVPDEYKQLMSALDAASPAEADAMRETLGTQLLKQYVQKDSNFPPQPKQAWLALQIMGSAYDSGMAGRVYGSFSAGDRQAIFNVAADYYPVAGRPGSDPLTVLVDSVNVAGTDGATAASGDKWSDIETDLVRYANTAQTEAQKSTLFWDSTHVISGRAEAYSHLLSAHGKAILDTMTDPRNQIVDPTGGDPGTTLVVADGRALANLMRATALAPDNPAHQQASDAIRSYIAEQHKAFGDGTTRTPAGEAAINRLARIGSAAQFAGEQLKGDLEADAAARAQLVGFCADIALAAVPLGSKFSGAATKALEDAFGSGVIAKAAQNATGALIDKATGTLTEEGKKAILDAMSAEGKDLANNIQAANLVKSAIFAGVGPNNIYNAELNQYMQDDSTALR